MPLTSGSIGFARRVVGLSSAMALDGHTIIPLPTTGSGITYVKRHRQCHS
ncbi:MAG: hypothetical protein IJT61_04750 [Bacteroidales bacterium]|nr:hypothetical protein [Bacteroidales bacterium]